ncbi:hypothetical protein F4679DRAFT_129033 [Xylaria curta]|nr:hypothetical protein F4679DRAFT_129033 [Xylaria curta]
MSSRTPLHIATSLGYNTSVQFLLASGSHITDECLDNVDESCIDILLTTLKQRRNELKVLAIENLTKSKAENLGLHEDQVLDSNAYEVQELLLKKGTYVPPKLYVGKNGWRDYCPVYTLTYYRKKTLMFDKLWALGFRDIDSCGLNGLTPLVIHRLNIEAVWWLIEHGADYWTPLSEKRSRPKSINQLLTPAHFCLVHIGQDLYENTRCTLSYNERRKWIFEKLIQVQVSDTCFSCPCFVGGCTPFKAFFDRLWDRAKYCPPQDLARWWQRSIRTVQTSLKEEDFMAALRRMTFDALRISHTCCNVYLRPLYNQKRLLTPEEADEINSEQDTLLTLFTDLLIELSQIAYEDRGGAPLIMNDPEEFWMHRWLPRITEVLDNLDGDNLTEEERSAAEAIGVVWSPQPAQVVNVEIRQPFGSEYVTREVEKIMNECMNE